MNRQTRLAVLIIVAALVTGCSADVPATVIDTQVQTTSDTSVVETETQETTVAETTVSPAEKYNLSAEGQAELDKAIKDMEDAIAVVNSSRHDEESHVSFPYKCFRSYDGLSDDEKAAYSIILEKTENYEAYTFDETMYDDMVWLIARIAVVEDYPRLRCYMGIDVTENGTSLFYSIPLESGELVTDVDIVRDKMNTFDAISETTAAMIPEDLSTYDKYRVIAHFISNRVNYNYEYFNEIPEISSNDFTAYSPICGGETVCGGYAQGFSYMCSTAGLWCDNMYGDVDGEGHGWNLIALEDGTYHVDVCWCDGMEALDSDWNDYFALTDEEILQSRTIDNEVTATGKRRFR